MPALEDAAARHNRPHDTRHLVADGDRGDARGLSGKHRDEARIDPIGLLLCVSDQRGYAEDQTLPQILVPHLGDMPQAFLAVARVLTRDNPSHTANCRPEAQFYGMTAVWNFRLEIKCCPDLLREHSRQARNIKRRIRQTRTRLRYSDRLDRHHG